MFNKFLLIFSVLAALVYSNSNTLVVNVSEYPPMVIVNPIDGQLEGFSIELWSNLARENGWEFKYNLVDTFSHIFDDIQNGYADVSICGITKNYERELIVDFSHTYLSTGLGAIVKKDKIELISYVKSNINFYIGLIFKILPFIMVWFIYVWFWAYVIWKLEQGNKMFDDKFKNGWGDSKFFVHVVISSTGFGNQIPLSKWGRRVAIILMYSGIGFMFPMVTGKISSEMTKKVPYTYIKSVDDVRGKKVVALNGRTAYNYAIIYGADVIGVGSIDSAVTMVKTGEADAFIYDKPALGYIVKKDKSLVLVDGMFNVENYGIVMPENSPLKEDINRYLLKSVSNGFMYKLKEKWLN